MSDLHTDCRHFRWDRPCAPHKERGVVCAGCDSYEPVRSRVAVVKLAAVGDVLRTTSMLPAIRAAHPDCWLVWITSAAAAELFAGNPLVDEVWTPADPSFAACLQTQSFDAVYCPDADPQTAVLAGALRATEHRGFRMDKQGKVLPLGEGAAHWLHMGVDDGRKRANTRSYQELIAEVLQLDPAQVTRPVLVPTAADQAAADELRHQLQHSGPLVGINTGAGHRWQRKRWTVAHQRRCVQLLAEAGIAVLLLGGPEEAGTHEELIPDDSAAPVRSAGTGHGYRSFAALVELCDVLITGDTMALHVATAREVPVVALFGPTSATEIELYGQGRKIQPEGLDCLGCYLPTCAVDPHCQERIQPETVVAAVNGLLGT